MKKIFYIVFLFSFFISEFTFAISKDSLIIQRFNNLQEKLRKENAGYKIKLNDIFIADMRGEAHQIGGLIIPDEVKEKAKNKKPKLDKKIKLPASYTVSGMSSIKNQSSCGACWAFATSGVVEYLTGKNDLSEKEYVECVTTDTDPDYGNNGCSGGWYGYSLDYTKRFGVSPESCFPYDASDADNCSDKCSNPSWKAYVTNADKYAHWGDPDPSYISTLKNYVYNYGPVAVSMYVPRDGSFDTYSGGVYHYADTAFNQDGRGHAVVVCGWDDSKGTGGAFYVRNSWGTSWGENGYFWIAYEDMADDGKVEFGGYPCYASGGYVQAGNNAPSVSLDNVTPVTANVGDNITATASATDPDGDNVQVKIDWGDGNISAYSSLAASGSSFNFSHSYSSDGTYTVKAKAKDANGAESNWSSGINVTITSSNTAPNISMVDVDHDTTSIGNQIKLTYKATDADGDNVAYKIDWGDGNITSWSSFVPENTEQESYYSYSDTGTFTIKVKAKDANGAESGWSSSLQVVVLSDSVINIVSPNGGEKFEVGTQQYIVWETVNFSGNVNIFLSIDNGKIFHPISQSSLLKINKNTENVVDSFLWTVPDSISDSCLIMAVYSLDTTISDTSDSVFSIVPKRTISIISPTGGEKIQSTIQSGNQKNIQWNSTGEIDSVTILFSSNGGDSFEVLAENISNTGSFNWDVPYVNSDECLIKIFQSDDSSVFGISDTFSVFYNSLSLIFPDSGGVFQLGHNIDIRWDYTGEIEKILILIENINSGIIDTIAKAQNVSTKNFVWNIPDTFQISDSYVVIIKSKEYPEISDTSDEPFSIVEPKQIEILKPNGGEILISGTTYRVEWDASESCTDFIIKYKLKPTLVYLQIGEVSNQNYFDWIVPNKQSSEVLIKVIDKDDENVSDRSDSYFTITEPINFTITKPSESDIYYLSDTIDIQWENTGLVDKVNLLISYDSMQNWTSIVNSIENTLSYKFYQDSVISDNCFIKIQASLDTTYFSISGQFSIQLKSLPSAEILAPSSDTTIFVNDSVYLLGKEYTGVGKPYYYWNLNGRNLSNSLEAGFVKFVSPGNNTVFFWYKVADKVSDTAFRHITVNSHPIPSIIEPLNDTTIYAGDSLYFKGSICDTIDGLTYIWLKDDEFYSNKNELGYITFEEAGDFIFGYYYQYGNYISDTVFRNITVQERVNYAPYKPLKPVVVDTGYVDSLYSLKTCAEDPENDSIYYLIDFGDGESSGWLGPFLSGDTCILSHKWTKVGEYNIIAKAKDHHDNISEESDISVIVVLNYTDIKENEIQKGIICKVYPNPANDKVIFDVVTSEGGHINIVVYDLLGNTVYEYERELNSNGEYRIKWDLINSKGNKLQTGVYFYKLSLGVKNIAGKLLIVK